MPLKVSSRLQDDIAVLEITGELTLGPSLTALRDAAKRALEPKKPKGMALLLGGVTSIDTSGLGELTVVYTFAARRGCRIVLLDVSPKLGKMLEMTRLDAILPSAADMASAKKHFEEQ